MKKSKIILLKCEKTIAKYRNHHTLYYNELVTAYREFKEQDFVDKNTRELYINHLNDLCNMIELENKSSISLLSISFLLIAVLFFAFVSTINFFNSKDKLDKNIDKANTDAKISVNYENMDDFNPFIYSNDVNYLDLKPIIMDLNVTAIKSKNERINYKVLMELDDENDISIDNFMVSVRSNSKTQDVRNISSCDKIDGKIIIFSDEINCNSTDKVEIRMWLKSNEVSLTNKKFKFKLNIDGSVI